MTFNFLGPGLTVNVEAKVKEQIILDSSVSFQKEKTGEVCFPPVVSLKNFSAFCRQISSISLV